MEAEALSEEERRALRGSKFSPIPAAPPAAARPQPRLAHPGGPMTTNKAAALAKFLERKLQQPGGLDSIDPSLLELAVKNAKETVMASNGGASSSGRTVRHVATFHDSPEEDSGENPDEAERKQLKKKKKKKVVESPKQDKLAKKLKKRKRKLAQSSEGHKGLKKMKSKS